MSTRREFAKTAVGALFGISVVPKCFEKPHFRWDHIMEPSWPPMLEMMQFFPPTNMKNWEPYISSEWVDMPVPDITIAQKIALKDRFS